MLSFKVSLFIQSWQQRQFIYLACLFSLLIKMSSPKPHSAPFNLEDFFFLFHLCFKLGKIASQCTGTFFTNWAFTEKRELNRKSSTEVRKTCCQHWLCPRRYLDFPEMETKTKSKWGSGVYHFVSCYKFIYQNSAHDSCLTTVWGNRATRVNLSKSFWEDSCQYTVNTVKHL